MVNKDKNSRAMEIAINEGQNTSAIRTLIKTYARTKSTCLLDMINSLPEYQYAKINERCKKITVSNETKSKIINTLYGY
jgi:ribosome biogenesis GTPase A